MQKEKVGVLGSGTVGETLANAFLELGYEVMRGSRDAAKLAAWAQSKGGRTGTFRECAQFGHVLVLAVKGSAAQEALALCGIDNLDGKLVLDATNPIADAPPQNGVLQFFTGANASLMEELQAAAPQAHFVKAFSCVGNAHMFRPKFQGGTPTMFICGNNAQAKQRAIQILSEFGWRSEDMGLVESARPIESLCMLWCARGFLQGQWNHAFALLTA